MKTVRVTSRSKILNDLLSQAYDEDLLLRTSDGTEYVLQVRDDFEAEVEATRKNEKLMAHLEACTQNTELTSLEDVKRELGITGKKKSSPSARPNGRRNRR
jgi:hypothetical protein